MSGYDVCKHGRIRCAECAYVEELEDRIEELEQQNKRYREALEKISAPIDKVTYAYMSAVKQIARQVKHWRVRNE